MEYREKELGPYVAFLLPSLKLKEPTPDGLSLENRLHDFLMGEFGGYTAQAGNIFGYWRESGRDSYGEHREFSVAASDPEEIEKLKQFLAALAGELGEECIYFRTERNASLLYPGD